MRRVILVRHATAVDTGPRGSDFHRKLKKRGKREAAIMADRMAGLVDPPDLILTSPADRALETAEIFAARFGYPGKRMEVGDELYGGLLPEDFLRILHRLEPAHRSVMIFGHDPSFTEFAAYLAPEFTDPIPKAGVVVIDLGTRSWKQVGPGTGTVAHFEQPPEPREQKRLEEDLLTRLQTALRAGILEALSRFEVAESPAVLRSVSGASERLAKALRPYAGAPQNRAARPAVAKKTARRRPERTSRAKARKSRP